MPRVEHRICKQLEKGGQTVTSGRRPGTLFSKLGPGWGGLWEDAVCTALWASACENKTAYCLLDRHLQENMSYPGDLRNRWERGLACSWAQKESWVT